MPRAIVELSHAMPDIALIPFAVVGDKWRDEPWWISGGTFRQPALIHTPSNILSCYHSVTDFGAAFDLVLKARRNLKPYGSRTAW